MGRVLQLLEVPPVCTQVMNKICRESEASLDYYSLFKAIMKRAPVPMSPLESLASSAVRTAHKARACRTSISRAHETAHVTQRHIAREVNAKKVHNCPRRCLVDDTCNVLCLEQFFANTQGATLLHAGGVVEKDVGWCKSMRL